MSFLISTAVEKEKGYTYQTPGRGILTQVFLPRLPAKSINIAQQSLLYLSRYRKTENCERLVMVCIELSRPSSSANVGLESLSTNALPPPMPMHACGAACVRRFRVRAPIGRHVALQNLHSPIYQDTEKPKISNAW